jgi:hypothetical protein
MPGQFPYRLPPSGPFTETTDDAALGAGAFTAHASGFPAERTSIVPNGVVTVPLSQSIPVTPGHTATFMLEARLSYSRTSTVGVADTTVSCSVALLNDGATVSVVSPGNPTMQNTFSGKGSLTGDIMNRFALIRVENTDKVDAVRFSLATGAATAGLDAGLSELVLTRIQ